VLDWARTFGIAAVVCRMSCIYGPRQLGTEDQGWVAHLLLRALRGERITIFGDGRQVRDVLFVDDLVDAFSRVRARIGGLAGRAFNLGGGASRTLSVLELVSLAERLTRKRASVAFGSWHPADQRWFVSDTRLLERTTGWRAKTSALEGVRRLFDWLLANHASARRAPELAAS
jgi:CDP-paratose 2-epimerase